jgi:hypothetical protein
MADFKQEDTRIHPLKTDETSSVDRNQDEPYSPAHQKMFLGQTPGTWYIYWICAVASIANM